MNMDSEVMCPQLRALPIPQTIILMNLPASVQFGSVQLLSRVRLFATP